MRYQSFSKLELLSAAVSALTVVMALVVVVAHVWLPITLESVYVGVLVYIGALALLGATALSVIQASLLAIFFWRKLPHRIYFLALYLAAILIWVASLIVVGYMTNAALEKDFSIGWPLWLFLIIVCSGFLHATSQARKGKDSWRGR